MAKSNQITNVESEIDMLPISRLWALRMLFPLEKYRTDDSWRGCENEDVLSQLGLTKFFDFERGSAAAKRGRAAANNLYQTNERELRYALVPKCLADNVHQLAVLIGLNTHECKILEFGVMVKIEPALNALADGFSRLTTKNFYHVLSVILGLRLTDVRAAFNANSVLMRAGLLSTESSGFGNLAQRLDLLSDAFAEGLFTADVDPISLLREMVAAAPKPVLALSDYEHAVEPLALVRAYLQRALETSRRGVNIFIYGAPGTGKSQLARVLAQSLGTELFEVASEDDEGDPIDGSLRVRAFRAAQCLFSKLQTLLVFDEVEDIFVGPESHHFGRGGVQKTKGWMNRALEDNPVPAIWLSNSVSCLDPAFARRFDMVFELGVPPKMQREKIINAACAGMLDAPTTARLAEVETLTPAVVTRAASVVRSICDDIGESGTNRAIEFLINNTLIAQGHSGIKSTDHSRLLALPDLYDPLFINAGANLTEIAAGLVTAKAGRLCLYGPPGTGKTAYGRWLAEQMGMPLLVKRGSDLMSMWLGETEKRIARAFKDAAQQGALLLIDEVDSFLQDRRGASQSWEISQVNEMLTQMESFHGVFIASTNLLASLDQSSLRRFDIKLKFDFMKPEQSWELLRRYCSKLEIATPAPEYLGKLMRLNNLTPGDFHAVARQNRFRPITSAASLVAALESECSVKDGSSFKMGF